MSVFQSSLRLLSALGFRTIVGFLLITAPMFLLMALALAAL